MRMGPPLRGPGASASRFLLSLYFIIFLIYRIDAFLSRFPAYINRPIISTRGKTLLSTLVVSAKTQSLVEEVWFPRLPVKDDDDIFPEKEINTEIESQSVELATTLVKRRLDASNVTDKPFDRKELIEDRFIDLVTNDYGEFVLESLFDCEEAIKASDDVIRGAVIVLQSLCVTGAQVGLIGTPDQLERLVSHLDPRDDESLLYRDLHTWDRESLRRLKYRQDRTPAIQLLACLKWKRSTQGAFDLLNAIGAWEKHEALPLIRSGFPLRFTRKEMQAAKQITPHDPDSILGIRRDLRKMKVFTIDSESTSEIDDGLSVEKVQKDDGSERHRIWVHIADADCWAPRNSTLFEMARQRVTSLYLPMRSFSMFPSDIASNQMSLRANEDAYALSLGVELNEDGSIDPSTVILTPSVIQVDYRLTYDEVDEMLDEGIGFFEEWELGSLLDAAKKRREYRIRNGSSEGMIPNPIPYASVSVTQNETAIDGLDISVSVQISHNAGKNCSAETGSTASDIPENAAPVSSAYLLVTEAMIMAGEAMGQWKNYIEGVCNTHNGELEHFPNQCRLPFRTQAPPDFKSRARERQVMTDLIEYSVGGGLCHAWYSRRFLQSVRVTETCKPHWGLGLECYVQWSSPIRRFTDLQVHTMVKRFLRRQKVYELLQKGETIPHQISNLDLGVPTGESIQKADLLDQDINFLEGIGLFGAAKTLQRQSQSYWIIEYVRRLRDFEPDVVFNAVVLGCVDPEKQQYAIYIYELGLEHRYTSPLRLDMGDKLILNVNQSSPRAGIMTFVRRV